jgi:C1A family cysteine protease
METPFVSERRSTRVKTAATFAIAVLGALAVSYLVFSNLPAETEFAFTRVDNQTMKDLYTNWKKQNNVTYGGPEDEKRFKIFTKTYNSIAQHNSRNLTYKLGLNSFSALSDAEFSSIMLGFNSKALRSSKLNVTKLPTANLKETVDWAGKGAVQRVKNQGSCGSCWAFSAVGALEGLGAIKGGKLQDFSEQELVDCSRSYGNNGCGGGLMSSAFKYVKDKGLAQQSEYPYKGVDAQCKSTSGSKFKISGYADVPANSAAQLKAAIARGPVSVAVQADSTVFRNYKSGVVTGTACGTNLNHGVLAVGYETSGTPYYKVKNSWGTAWGDQGYIKIGITEGAGFCGIQKMSSYPTA